LLSAGDAVRHPQRTARNLYRAYVTRASDQAEGDARRLTTRRSSVKSWCCAAKKPGSLGYDNFGQVSVVPKMAQSPEEVVTSCAIWRAAPVPTPKKTWPICAISQPEQLGLHRSTGMGLALSLREAQGGALRLQRAGSQKFFTAPKVLAGLFKIIETLFEVSIRRDSAPVWNAAVEFYRIERNGQLVGQFYLDQPARTGKRGGAWMDDVRTRWLRPDTGVLQTPVAHLVCNFADGVDGKPALLTHDDVITLFHEFGHGLHHMLTQVNERDVSGIGGVEWDAVELPSQFMENFCWEWDVLRT
jgi:oligopeptidase A